MIEFEQAKQCFLDFISYFEKQDREVQDQIVQELYHMTDTICQCDKEENNEKIH